VTKKKVQRKAAKPAKSKRSARKAISQKCDTAGLTAKQQAFIAEYLANGFNGTQAAVKAGYSAKTADSQASRLLKVPAVAAAIAAKQQPRLEKLEITAERVLSEIAKLAFFDPRRLFRDDGTLIAITQLDDDTAAAIAGLEVYVEKDDGEPIGETKKFKLADKGANLERLGRHLKLFTDRVEHKHSGTLKVIAELSDEELEAKLKAYGVDVAKTAAG
jgi:phage terminase small subunit